MTRRTIDNVIEEIDEWQSRYGDFMYTVKAFFTNKEFVRATKKSKDAALELQGLLMESAQRPHEFILEADGVSKAGNPKWKLLAFGPIEGTYTYSTLKDGQGVGSGGSMAPDGALRNPNSSVSPDPTRTINNIDASIRASVALKAAASLVGGSGEHTVALRIAEEFDAWLAKKSSGVTPQGSPEETDGGVGTEEGPAPSSKTTWQERVKDWPDPSENPL